MAIHLAAEPHVDRSIRDPRPFLEAKICGTYTLLEACRRHGMGLDGSGKAGFRFHQVSTDEVSGSRDADDSFTEESPYWPRSRYAASKAAADHLAVLGTTPAACRWSSPTPPTSTGPASIPRS